MGFTGCLGVGKLFCIINLFTVSFDCLLSVMLFLCVISVFFIEWWVKVS